MLTFDIGHAQVPVAHRAAVDTAGYRFRAGHSFEITEESGARASGKSRIYRCGRVRPRSYREIYSSPCSIAYRVSSTRLASWSLRKVACTWFSTVR